MLKNKKLHFYQLCFVSIGVVVITLLINWGYFSPTEKTESMMAKSMGNMMSSMHLKNAKLSDLFVAEAQKQSSVSTNYSNEMTISHTKKIYYITTITIIVLLPLIIAGTVFLTIVWIK